jgi:gas vesicle protein
MGVVTGSLLGAALAVLFAPKSGSDMRQDLVSGAGELGQTAKERWEDVSASASSAVEKGRDAYEQARTTGQEVSDQVGQSVDRLKAVATDVANDVASATASSASSGAAAAAGRRQRR